MQVSFARAGAVLALAALLCSCGPVDPKKPPPKHRLEGSLSSLIDLGWDEARILVTGTDFSLLFVRIRPADPSADGGSAGASEDYPIKITYALLNDGPFGGGRVDLSELIPTGEHRAIVSRNVLADPRKTFPGITRGTLYMNRAPNANALVSGDFNVTFENGVEAASGRTVFGPYDAKVVQ